MLTDLLVKFFENLEVTIAYIGLGCQIELGKFVINEKVVLNINI